jgi:hypothetical protein
MAHFIESETADPVGRGNFMGGVVLFMYAVIATFHKTIMEVAKLILGKSDWTEMNPLLLFGGLAIYFLISLRLIPRKPPL